MSITRTSRCSSWRRYGENTHRRIISPEARSRNRRGGSEDLPRRAEERAGARSSADQTTEIRKESQAACGCLAFCSQCRLPSLWPEGGWAICLVCTLRPAVAPDDRDIPAIGVWVLRDS